MMRAGQDQDISPCPSYWKAEYQKFPYPLTSINCRDSDNLYFARMFRFSARTCGVLVASIIALVSPHSLGAAPQAAPAVSPSPLSAEQLDRLVAPIALDPDPLVAQILMAATYPLEIVEADRWLQDPAHAQLQGAALTTALQQEPWDPSVKSLVPFSQLLRMMDKNLDWTEQLGDAFLAQQADVMDALQRLRQRALAAGSLASTPQQTVSTEDQEIVIEPTSPDVIYTPTYNPWCIYGQWPDPEDPPIYFGTWGGYCASAENIISFGSAIYPFAFWAWGHFDWHRHNTQINRDRFQQFHAGHEPPSEIWQHDSAHRHGVPYRDAEATARFLGAGNPAAQREPRGFAPAPAVVAPARPAVPSVEREPPVISRPAVPLAALPHPAPPAFESFGQGAQVRGEAARGFSSRMSAPAPSFHPAPMPSFGGGGRR
jgi:hypothetical protein